jgi:hypothetical protein
MKMNETDLLSFLEEEARQAYHHNDGGIASDRARSERDYMRTPYGNEEEGHSSVVASDVFDAIEGVLPDLIEVFTASDKAVVFEPVGPEDVESAEQVTNACNYVFYKQNNGFFVLYSAIKDGLMLKTGGIKWYWEKRRTPTFTTYRDVDEMQLAVFLTTNPDAEIVEQEEQEPKPEEVQQAQAVGMEVPKRFTVKVKTVAEKGRVAVCAIPPNELQVSRRHNSLLLDECPYVAHVVEKTLSDIKQMGYRVTIDDVKAATEDSQSIDRHKWDDDNNTDDSMVRGWLREEYVLVDFDGDGIAERRRVVRLGDKVLENVECSHVPIAAWTPYILTHQFSGISLADLTTDFQRISTEIVRQQLDNLALANNQETVVLTNSQGTPQANLDDLLNRRPGGIIRESQPGAVRPYNERWQGIEAMPMVELLNVAKENRTGWTRYSQGLDADSLNKTMGGMKMIMNASQKRMKLMARICAEALVAPMFRGIFKTLTDYGMEEISFRLHGNFVQYDPQNWRDQYDMTINVGIGTGDVQQQSVFLAQMAQAQAVVAQSPLGGKLITPKNIYNLQARLAENAGFKNPGEFWTDPGDGPMEPPPPPPPDPRVMLAQAQLQNDQQKTQAEMQIGQQKTQAEMQAEQQRFEMKLQFDAQQAELKRQHELELEAMRIQAKQQECSFNAAIANQRTATIGEDGEVVEEPGMQEVMMAQISQSLAMLAQAMNAPKQVIRDETGRAIGVAPVQ